MKFTIEIDEFWLGEEEELEPALKKFITRDVCSQVTKSIQEMVDKQITEKVTEAMNSRLNYIINERIAELIETGTIVRSGKEISLVSHIKEMFNNNHGWNNPNEVLKKIAKQFAEELKLQYNNIFANQIVQNMKEQGLLKDEVVQILLEGRKG